MSTKPGYNLNLSYEPRIGALILGFHKNGTAAPEALFQVPVSTILRDLKIPPAALRQAALVAAKPDEDAGDVEAVHRASVPTDCTGLSVLDIGGYHGRLAKLALDRGAKWAVVVDSGQYRHYGWPKPEPLDGVLYVEGDFLDWHVPADLVFFMNVIYHVKDPWRALEHLRAITRREMVICSLVTWTDQPTWEVYEPREVNPTDETVYWGPSEAGLHKLLKLTGWTDVTEVGHAFERLVLRCR
jgi:SAM-dependent methyltransferase